MPELQSFLAGCVLGTVFGLFLGLVVIPAAVDGWVRLARALGRRHVG